MVGLPEFIQASFLAASSAIVFVDNVPELRSRFLAYGLRATPVDPHKGDGIKPAKSSKGLISRFLDRLGSIQAPHGYFKHFYILSVLSSIFWAFQILSQGSVLKYVASLAHNGNTSTPISMDRMALSWALLLLQGVRRLVESTFVTKTSASKMWFVHYLLGMGFYLVMGVAVWIEGAATLFSSPSPWHEISFSAPSVRTLLCIPIFILASGIQHDCHTYLASLPKYTLPSHPIFQVIICPHYFAECLIYTSMTILGAPSGAWINTTLAAALLFVVVNLGVTASTSKDWYAQKFGKEKVAGRWKMIPFVY